jgi:thiamine-phosphate pyrophosphorylase
MLLYAITSRVLLAETERERGERLVALAARWAGAGVDFVQIRERELGEAELLALAAGVVEAARRGVRPSGRPTRVLVNGGWSGGGLEGGISIARRSGADGLHLRGGMDSGQLAAAVARIREEWVGEDSGREESGRGRASSAEPVVSVACHSTAEVLAARAAGATLALFAPVFEKPLQGAAALGGRGLGALSEACAAARRPGPLPPLPVFALGGVTVENAAECVAAGAAGVAAIRLFLDVESIGSLTS